MHRHTRVLSKESNNDTLQVLLGLDAGGSSLVREPVHVAAGRIDDSGGQLLALVGIKHVLEDRSLALPRSGEQCESVGGS